MLPKFPNFKSLELADEAEIEKITAEYDPYSDFNFHSLWAWNVKEEVKAAVLNGNLVLSTEDYLTEQVCYSFLGNKDRDQTIATIFAFLEQQSAAPCQLRLMPQVSVEGIDLSKYRLEEDLNNNDYIFGLRELAAYPGNKFEDKRRKLNGFVKKYPTAEVQVLSMQDPETHKHILELNNSWSENKSKPGEYFYLHKELLAIQRLLKANFNDSLCVAVFVDGKFVAYSLFNLLPNHFAICQFSKGNIAYAGVYEFLMQRSAQLLLEQGCEKLNYQEDLGLAGLRFFKRSFKPTQFLSKYTVFRKADKQLTN
jgi:hypothetical protein